VQQPAAPEPAAVPVPEPVQEVIKPAEPSKPAPGKKAVKTKMGKSAQPAN
jgi:hypothetical protein